VRGRSGSGCCNLPLVGAVSKAHRHVAWAQLSPQLTCSLASKAPSLTSCWYTSYSLQGSTGAGRASKWEAAPSTRGQIHFKQTNKKSAPKKSSALLPVVLPPKDQKIQPLSGRNRNRPAQPLRPLHQPCLT
jgi:hypothetical protein